MGTFIPPTLSFQVKICKSHAFASERHWSVSQKPLFFHTAWIHWLGNSSHDAHYLSWFFILGDSAPWGGCGEFSCGGRDLRQVRVPIRDHDRIVWKKCVKKIISGEQQRQTTKESCIHWPKKGKNLNCAEIPFLWGDLCGRTKFCLRSVLIETLQPALTVAFKD